MKILQVIAGYPGYLNNFNNRLLLRGLSWVNAIALYEYDGFLMPHNLVSVIRARGFEAEAIVYNNPLTQILWAKEHQCEDLADPIEILIRQIDLIQPDVLYIMDPISLDSSFINRLLKKPDIIVGWRSAPTPTCSDFSRFDLLLSSLPSLFNQLYSQGAPRVEYFLPGIDYDFVNSIEETGKEVDVVFCGQYSPFHTNRNALMRDLVVQKTIDNSDISFKFFLATSNPLDLPAAIFINFLPPVWGRDMLISHKRARASFHFPVDIAGGNSTAMRVFEVCSTGTPLFLHESSSIEGILAEDEVVRFSSASDFIRKFLDFRDGNNYLAEIGRKAEVRCKAEHSSIVRASQFLKLVAC